MKRAKIRLDLPGQEEFVADAYVFGNDGPQGIAIHRKVKWVPAKQEHRYESKWQITHIESGFGILSEFQCMKTKHDTVLIAKRLWDIDWSLSAESLRSDPNLPGKVQRAVEAVKYGEADKEDEAAGEVEKDVIIRRYVVRRASFGYSIYDLNNEQEVENHAHRGIAAAKAKELNEKASV